MRLSRIIFFLLFVLAISSCRKDDIVGEPGETVILTPEPSVSILANFSGMIVNENNQPLSGVAVQIGEINVTTDERGFYAVNGISLKENGSLITMTKSGFFKNYKFAAPTPSGGTYLKTMLITREQAGAFNATTGSNISFDGGASVTFPENAIVTADGNPYSGEVRVYAHWFNPEDELLAINMPGDLRGLNPENEIRQLQSFGMVAVELEGNSGQELQIAEGKTASLSFPLPGDTEGIAPGVVPLWSFDEGNGFWREEGEATLSNGKYEGEVSHFSFWNCDAPFPLIKLSGKILNTENLPISHSLVCLFVNSTGLSAGGFTDGDGHFCGKVPKDKEMTLSVKNECGSVVFETIVGPFSQDTDMGAIFADIDSANEFVLTGTVVDCNTGLPVPNAIVVVEGESGYPSTINTDENGSFNTVKLICNSSTALLTAYDISTNLQSESLSFNLTPGEIVNVGIIEICTDIEEFISFKYDGNSYLETENIDVTIEGTELIITNGVWYGSFNTDNISTADPSFATSLYINITSDNSFIDALWCSDFDGCDVEFTFTDLELTEGGVLSGSYMGEMDSKISGPVTIMGEFNVFVDTVTSTGTVNGLAWLDNNISGTPNVFDVGDSYAPGLILEFINSAGDKVETIITNSAPFSVQLPGETEYFIRVTNPNSSLVEKWAAGNDGTDSDFDPTTLETDPFYLSDNQVIEGMNLGITIPEGGFLECSIGYQDFIACDGQPVTIFVDVTGGTPPYSYAWSDGSTGGNTTVLAQAEYSVSVVDVNGENCVTSAYVGGGEEPFAEIYNVVASQCGQENGSFMYEAWSPTGALEVSITPDVDISNNTVTNLAPGTYTIFVIDNGTGCENSFQVIIEEDCNGVLGNVFANQMAGENLYIDSLTMDPLPGVVVELYNANDESTPVETTQTDMTGFYQFSAGNYFGEYYIIIQEPVGYDFIIQDDGSGNISGSQVNPADGRSYFFELGNQTFNVWVNAILDPE